MHKLTVLCCKELGLSTFLCWSEFDTWVFGLQERESTAEITRTSRNLVCLIPKCGISCNFDMSSRIPICQRTSSLDINVADEGPPPQDSQVDSAFGASVSLIWTPCAKSVLSDCTALRLRRWDLMSLQLERHQQIGSICTKKL
jgi:hypothetical protein